VGDTTTLDRVVSGRSAYPPILAVIADTPAWQPRATFRPEQVQQTEQALLDHLVGAGEQARWFGETKRLGGRHD
jgi:hypothetical protein